MSLLWLFLTDANMEGEDRHDIATPHDDWEIHSPTMEKQLSDGTGVMEKKKKARIRVGMGELKIFIHL